MKPKQRGGFTLLEVLIAAVLLLAVLGSTVVVQMTTAGLLTTTTTGGRMNEQALDSLERIASELRWAEVTSLLVTAQNGSSRIDFKIPTDYVGGNIVWSSTIRYSVNISAIDLDGNGILDDGQLVRQQAGVTRVLCKYVAVGGFTAVQTGNNVALQLDLTKVDTNTNQHLKDNAGTSISLRN